MLQRLKNIIKHNRALYSFLLLLISPYRNYLDSRQRKLYELWQRDYKVVRTNKRLYRQPLVSIIVPTYNTPTKYLREMVQSVESQSYDNWELIIVDDASPDTGLKQEISAIAKTNAKIKPLFLKANHHIAGATNYGIHKASGEYVALLDHDDVLHPDALLRIVEKINNLPDLYILMRLSLMNVDDNINHFSNLIGMLISCGRSTILRTLLSYSGNFCWSWKVKMVTTTELKIGSFFCA